MGQLGYILADGFKELLEFLPWLVLVVIGLIVKGVASASKQKQAQQQAAHEEQIRRDEAEPARRQPQQAPRPQGDSGPLPPPPPSQLPQVPPQPAEQIGRILRQAMGIPDQPAPAPRLQPAVLQPARAPVPPEKKPSHGLGSPGLRPTAIGLSRLKPREAAEEAPPPPVAPVGLEGIDLGLADAGLARQAIVYHEVFSSPKALRTGSEMWDL